MIALDIMLQKERKEQMRLFSFDTGSKRQGKKSIPSTGWALYIDGKYRESGIIIFDVREVSYKFTGALRADFVVYEWTNMPNQQRKKDKISQALQQDAIWTICQLHGIESEGMSPSTWRNILDFPKAGDLGRNQLKDLAKVKASQIAGREITSEDEADAICQGAAWVKREARS